MVHSIFGVIAILFGIYVLYARHKSPEQLIKLKMMKEFFGEKKGNIIHLIFYCIVPVLIGIALLLELI